MQGIPEIKTPEQARAFFSNDRFATGNGMTIESVEPRHAVIRLELDERHRNGVGGVMGGVMMTMSDFACAVASIYDSDSGYVTANANVSFLNAARGKTLFAESVCVKRGRMLDFYEVTIKDDLGTLISKADFTMFRV
ncbi:MAG: PaaI family thioesterase [Clostridia bacterium]|nr:PaaI family thioesterase [Clostridia bacterium]MBR5427802.1 PaaI family thioesterase [Clostridia bacterium]